MVFLKIILSIREQLEPLAYIDPSTGGMLFQILAAAFALFSGFVFFFSRQIKAFFARMRRKMRGQENEPNGDEKNSPE